MLVLVHYPNEPESRTLMNKYGVTGFPTVIFTDHKGTEVGKMKARSPGALSSQMKDIAAKYSRSIPWRDSIEEAVADGKKQGKPTLIFFGVKGQKKTEILESFFAEAEASKMLDQFVIVRKDYSKKCQTCKSYKAKPNMLYFIDGEQPEKALQRTTKFKSPKALKKALEKALKKFEKAVKKREAAKEVDV